MSIQHPPRSGSHSTSVFEKLSLSRRCRSPRVQERAPKDVTPSSKSRSALVVVALGLALLLAPPSMAQVSSDLSSENDRSSEGVRPAELTHRPRNNRLEAAQEMERAREIKMLDASVQMFVAPFVSLQGGQEAELVLTSRFAEPFDLSIKAVDWKGRISAIDNLTIQPRQRVVLDLRQALVQAGQPLDRISLRVEHFGHPEMLQSWIAFTNAYGRAVMPLVGASSFDRVATSFWSLGWAHRPRDRTAHAAYVLHNRTSTYLHVDVAMSAQSRSDSRNAYDIPPDASVLLRARPGSGNDQGTIVISHDGEDGQLAVAGLVLSANSVISSLPVADRDALANLKAFSSAGIPEWSQDLTPYLAAYDARTEGNRQSITAEILDFETGAVLQRYESETAPGQLVTFDQLPGGVADTSKSHRLRLRLEAEQFGVLPYSVSSLSHGSTVVENELLPHSKTHSNGTYPLPSPHQASSNTVILNLGDEPAEIFGYIVTDRGEYALDPFTVPANGAYDLSFDELISAHLPDRIGRQLRSDFQSGFFQWSSRGPSFDLLARTNVSRPGSEDVIGFNCFGCCSEIPSGALYPDESYVFTGESAFFEPQVYVDTCAGLTGPYPAYVTSRSFSSPITWSGTSLNTTGETEQDVGFFGEGEFVSVTCQIRTRNYLAFGPVGFFTDCQDQNNPGRNGYESCQQQPKPGETCDQCCDKQRQVGNCICDKLPLFSGLCKVFVGHAYRNCLENCAF